MVSVENYLEEDFRFATPLQVKNYTPDELQVKPHAPGFALMQLMDQMSGHVIRTPEPKFWIRAFGGTAYWLARHLDGRASVDLWLPPGLTPHSRHQLANLSQSVRITESDAAPCPSEFSHVTCVVLACWFTECVAWYDICRQHPILGSKLILTYDPNRSLKSRPEGYYFLNSSIWVTRDHGSRIC